MIITNIRFKKGEQFDEHTQQIIWTGLHGKTVTLTCRDYKDIDKISNTGEYSELMTPVAVPGSSNRNAKNGAFHINSAEDGSVYVIFGEYDGPEKAVNISLKNPIYEIDTRSSSGSHRESLQVFKTRKTEEFAIIYTYGNYSKQREVLVWDGSNFKNMGDVDWEEIHADTDDLKYPDYQKSSWQLRRLPLIHSSIEIADYFTRSEQIEILANSILLDDTSHIRDRLLNDLIAGTQYQPELQNQENSELEL